MMRPREGRQFRRPELPAERSRALPRAGRGCRAYLRLALVLLGAWASSLGAREAYVVISGGDTPWENQYSQYLQARAMAAFFLQHYPPNSVWVFFGAGNIAGEPARLGDVHREVQRQGLTLDSWQPGSLPHNRPATRAVILRALREEILPAVAGGGTLYLFVGDHGSRTRGNHGESIINLWSLERAPGSAQGWRVREDATLGVAELRQALAQGLGQGRAVFCMTQCHSGGFHYLAIPHLVPPDPHWFTRLPSWANATAATTFPRVAGFTATDELSPAAGCEPNPDPEKWAGYERFLPEALLGQDLFTLRAVSRGLPSFAAAHAVAALRDSTIDKPCSTSEQYLERWANLIDTRLAKSTNLTDRVRRQVGVYERTVDGAWPNLANRAWREHAAEFHHFIERFTQDNPSTKTLLLTGTRRDLQAAIGGNRARRQAQARAQVPAPSGGQGSRRRGRGQFAERRRLWNDILRPAWRNAIETEQIRGLPPAVLQFEQYLLRQEAAGKDYLFADMDELPEAIFWHSGYADPQTVEPAQAEAVARWGVERAGQILAWAKTAPDETVREAAQRVAHMRSGRRPGPAPLGPERDSEAALGPEEPINKAVAAERTLFYRRVLAAWQFLLALDERPALVRLREIQALERVPLPGLPVSKAK